MARIIKIGSLKFGGHLSRAQLKQQRREARRLEREAFVANLKENPTNSEIILRDALLAKGYKFEFQELLFGYIPDFYFPKHKKMVELDGKTTHDKEKDARRDAHFLKRNIKTLRIRSHRVFHQLDWVIEEIEAFLTDKQIARRSKSARKFAKKRKHRMLREYFTPTGKTDRLTDEFMFATEGI